jgi:hypothetical protein
MRIPDQIVENGIAIDATTMYMVTGPAPSTSGTVGYMDAFTAGPGGSIKTPWQDAYDAGSARKPGGFARGSGSTPTLLGHQYVAITDNADNQIHLLVYPLDANPNRANRQVCSVPLFTPGASANDIGTIGFHDRGTFSVVALNDYNAPPIGFNPTNPNTPNNDLERDGPRSRTGKCLTDRQLFGGLEHPQRVDQVSAIPIYRHRPHLRLHPGRDVGFLRDSRPAHDAGPTPRRVPIITF